MVRTLNCISSSVVWQEFCPRTILGLCHVTVPDLSHNWSHKWQSIGLCVHYFNYNDTIGFDSAIFEVSCPQYMPREGVGDP